MALLRLYCSRGGPLLARGFPSRSALLSFSLSELGPTLFAFSSSSSSISSSHALYFNLFRAAATSQKPSFSPRRRRRRRNSLFFPLRGGLALLLFLPAPFFFFSVFLPSVLFFSSGVVLGFRIVRVHAQNYRRRKLITPGDVYTFCVS